MIITAGNTFTAIADAVARELQFMKPKTSTFFLWTKEVTRWLNMVLGHETKFSLVCVKTFIRYLECRKRKASADGPEVIGK